MYHFIWCKHRIITNLFLNNIHIVFRNVWLKKMNTIILRLQNVNFNFVLYLQIFYLIQFFRDKCVWIFENFHENQLLHREKYFFQ